MKQNCTCGLPDFHIYNSLLSPRSEFAIVAIYMFERLDGGGAYFVFYIETDFQIYVTTIFETLNEG